jgi:hypothetical protein
VALAGRAWEAAEESLGAALAAAEAVSTDRHARLAPALLLLGQLYSRTARVTFAEGMLREAAKLLRLDPARAGAAAAAPQLCHPSLLAALAWRAAQLLDALPPSRAGEGGQWRRCAEEQWGRAGRPYEGAAGGLAGVLGEVGALKGGAAAGSGALLSLGSRRLLLLAPPAGAGAGAGPGGE